jgi:hypothetical protein
MTNKLKFTLLSFCLVLVLTLLTSKVSASVIPTESVIYIVSDAKGGTTTTQLCLENTYDESVIIMFETDPYEAAGDRDYSGSISSNNVTIAGGGNACFTVTLDLPSDEDSFWYSGYFEYWYEGKTYSTQLLPNISMTARVTSPPTDLTVSNKFDDYFNLSWTSYQSSISGYPTSYDVYNGSTLVKNTTSKSCDMINLSSCTSYSMAVIANYSSGYSTEFSAVKAVKTTGCCEVDIPATDIPNVADGTDEQLASNSITANNTISGGATVHYGATNLVKLITGFKVSSGCSFLADLNGCTEVSTKSTNDYVEPNEDLSIEKQSEEINLSLPNGILLYPNPTNGQITIATENDELKQIAIYNLSGALIYSVESINRNVEIDLSEIAGGIYIARIVQNSSVVNKQFVIE